MTDDTNWPDAFSEPVFLSPASHVGKHNRHLPHWQLEGGFYFSTWRLADSLPREKLRGWMEERRNWLKENPKPWDDATRIQYREQFPARIEKWLDAGYGSCVLRDKNCASIVANAIHYFDGERYDVASFVVMPNHVHTLFQLRGTYEIETVLGNLKSYTALHINRRLLRQGALWQQENWEHLLRGAADLFRCFAYIKENPGAANLSPEEFVYYEYPKFLPEDLT